MAIKATFEFEEAPGFRLYPCGGVWGGVNPGGVVVANFFVDLNPNPVSVTLSPDESGKAEEVERNPPVNSSHEVIRLRRQLMTGVILSPQDAISIGNWLVQQGMNAIAASNADDTATH